jgi:hypothetical protein
MRKIYCDTCGLELEVEDRQAAYTLTRKYDFEQFELCSACADNYGVINTFMRIEAQKNIVDLKPKESRFK